MWYHIECFGKVQIEWPYQFEFLHTEHRVDLEWNLINSAAQLIARFCLFVARGQFWPSGIVIACVCVSVCPCINHGLVRAITHHSFKLASPNLEHMYKRPWLRTLSFWGDRPWPSRPNLTWKSTFTSFWACPHDSLSPVLARITKFGPEMHFSMVEIPIIVFGVDRPWPSRSNLT